MSIGIFTCSSIECIFFMTYCEVSLEHNMDLHGHFPVQTSGGYKCTSSAVPLCSLDWLAERGCTLNLSTLTIRLITQMLKCESRGLIVSILSWAPLQTMGFSNVSYIVCSVWSPSPHPAKSNGCVWLTKQVKWSVNNRKVNLTRPKMNSADVDYSIEPQLTVMVSFVCLNTYSAFKNTLLLSI